MRDNSVTVTRESRVTEANMGVTLPVTNRVSHATTTTPHHTMFVLAASCGCGDEAKSNLTVSYALLGLEPVA